MSARGWNQLDIIIITGDAYIDHPGFGAAIIGRWLEAHGFRVGIIPQPDWHTNSDFQALGRPRLFFGVTAGNMDSLVNHYTAQKKIRSNDAYSPGDQAGLRPDRATIVYTQKLRELFKGVPVIIGGIEASLRRIPHYDYWSDKVRNSLLFDSKADLLVYGMAEIPVLFIAQQLAEGKSIREISRVPGTVEICRDPQDPDGLILPEYHPDFSREEFYRLNLDFFRYQSTKTLYQAFSGRWLRHNPPVDPLTTQEMDRIYALPFIRLPHPRYQGKKITAYEQIKGSITSHRGCFGGCSFCALTVHQGKAVQSRSPRSILQEVDALTELKEVHGIITDIGGPTANMYGIYCRKKIERDCPRDSCLYPDICPNLHIDFGTQKKILRQARASSGVKNVFLASGIRFDLALLDHDYIREIALHHTGGLLKLAPEHKSRQVLKLMNKPEFAKYVEFVEIFQQFSLQAGKQQFVVPYIIVGHPGSTLQDGIELAVYLKQHNIRLQQVQEFTPTPMTLSTMMYYTEMDGEGRKIPVPRGREVRLQKALVQWYEPANRKLVIEALTGAGRKDLIRYFYPPVSGRSGSTSANRV